MLHNVPKAWIAAAWLVALVALLWAVSGSVSVTGVTAVAIIGLVPLVVMLILARDPEQTMAESIRAVVTDRAR